MKAPSDSDLLAHIESFLARSGMKPTRFGLDAAGEGSFVDTLRGGRSPSLKKVNRVLEFIRDHDDSDRSNAADDGPVKDRKISGASVPA